MYNVQGVIVIFVTAILKIIFIQIFLLNVDIY